MFPVMTDPKKLKYRRPQPTGPRVPSPLGGPPGPGNAETPPLTTERYG